MTGIIRRVDEFGRVVIPREIRRALNWRDGDAIEISTTNKGEVKLLKYVPEEEKICNIANNLLQELDDWKISEKTRKLLTNAIACLNEEIKGE